MVVTAIADIAAAGNVSDVAATLGDMFASLGCGAAVGNVSDGAAK